MELPRQIDAVQEAPSLRAFAQGAIRRSNRRLVLPSRAVY